MKIGRVGEICEQIRGVSYSKSEATDHPIPGSEPILRANGITDHGLVWNDLVYVPSHRISGKQRLQINDVVVAASSGSLSVVGKAAQVRCQVQGAFGAFCKALRPGPEVDPHYFGHFFRTEAYRRTISRLAAGANINNLKNEHLDDLEFPLPPLSEQKRIAAILDAADALRAKRRASIEQLESLVQAIFLDMFGDPVRNPKGWDVCRFGDLGDCRLGKMLDRGKQRGDGDYPYLANRNVKWGVFDLTELPEMSFSAQDRQEFRLVKGDLLICEGGEVGRTAIWREEREGVYFQKALHRLRLYPHKAVPEYVQYYMWFMANGGGFRDYTSSATIAHLTGVKLKTLPCPLPPIDVQARFASIVEAVEAHKVRLKAQHAELDTLFASLQVRAFSGELCSGPAF